MHVLNTIEGGTSVGMIVLSVICFVLAVVFIFGAVTELDSISGFAAVVFVLVGIVSAVECKNPTKYEVTLDPGHVIDARKYEIVEQRGEIYVIKEAMR